VKGEPAEHGALARDAAVNCPVLRKKERGKKKKGKKGEGTETPGPAATRSWCLIRERKNKKKRKGKEE